MKLTISGAMSNAGGGDFFKAANKLTHNSEIGSRIKDQNCCVEAIWYLPGMITHAISLIRDAVAIAVSLVGIIFFGCLALLACTKSNNLNECAIGSVILFLSSLSSLAVDALGVICPPLAYRINEKAYSAFKDMALLNNLD